MVSCRIGKRVILEVRVLGVLPDVKGSLIGYSIINLSKRMVEFYSIKFRVHTDKGDIDHWVAGVDLPPNGNKTNLIYSSKRIEEIRGVSILYYMANEEAL